MPPEMNQQELLLALQKIDEERRERKYDLDVFKEEIKAQIKESLDDLKGSLSAKAANDRVVNLEADVKILMAWKHGFLKWFFGGLVLISVSVGASIALVSYLMKLAEK